MLLELSIENFVTIKKLDLSFDTGLSVFTGETGAGKSMLLHAMQTLLGRRLGQDLIGPHKDHVRVAGLFSYEKLNEEVLKIVGDVPAEGELLLVREITKAGRSRAFINGHLASIGQLTEVGAQLINICGQHQSVRILDQANYLGIVDEYGSLATELGHYTELFHQVAAKRERVAAMRESASRSALRQAELQHLISDIAKVCDPAIDRGEIEGRLKAQRSLEDLQETRMEFLEAVEGTAGVLRNLRSARSALQQSLKVAPHLSGLIGKWDDAVGKFEGDLNSITAEVNKQLGGTDLDERELEELRSTLSAIAGLERKYRRDHGGLKELFQKAKTEFESLEVLDDELPKFEKELRQVESRLQESAEALSRKRKTAAKKLQELVQVELRELSIADALFVVDFEVLECGVRGLDKVDFKISTSKGMPPRSLAAVASGGELSRITLALKKILSDRSGVNVLVFDEVDTGISGRVARVVGEKLRQLGQNGAQVLCVTHLPQIASLADHHFEVFKDPGSDSGHTQTAVRRLESGQKVNEIAKMLAGLEVTKATLVTAEELIASKAG